MSSFAIRTDCTVFITLNNATVITDCVWRIFHVQTGFNTCDCKATDFVLCRIHVLVSRLNIGGTYRGVACRVVLRYEPNDLIGRACIDACGNHAGHSTLSQSHRVLDTGTAVVEGYLIAGFPTCRQRTCLQGEGRALETED